MEIGCGIGHLLRPISSFVTEAHEVDISGEMLRLANERSAAYANIFFHKTEGRLDMFPDDSMDFVFCCGTFIHFPSKPLVYEYFKEAARVLKTGGIFRIHVDGRHYLRWRSNKGGTLRGVVFNSMEILEQLKSCGFVIVDEPGEGSDAMWTTGISRKG